MIILQQTRGNLSSGDQLSLDLPFAATKSLAARVGPTPVFTRASIATFVGSNGLIQIAGNNVARFDHTSSGVSRGLLIEESKTNLWLQSENFASASWTKDRGSISNATNTSPNGSATSELFSEDTSTGSHRVFQASAYVSGATYTISVYLKFAGRQHVIIQNPSVATSFAVFDIQNGVVTATSSGTTASITSVGNGWYRCSATATATSSLTGSAIIAGAINSSGGTSYPGSGGPAFYIYGSQVEAGSLPTSYIPTTTASVVRSADVCSISGANFASFYNQSEGTLYADYDRSTNQGAGTKFTWMVAALYNSSSLSTYSVLQSSHVSDARMTYRNAGTDVYTNNPSLLASNAIIKASYGYKSGDFAGARNGSIISTGTGVIPTVSTFDRIEFGFSNNGNFGAASTQYLNGHIAAIRYYRNRLPNSKLVALTT
jgi:hypothetical protein